MPITTIGTANDIINRVAAEVGLAPVVDAYASQDQAFIQMQYLLQTAGEELVTAYPWELLVRAEQFLTVDTDSGNYPLPVDFSYMIDQTGWERTNNVPLFGGLSAQDWTYLLGRDLAQNTIYASFRLKDGTFSIFPQPPPNNLDINYEYISKDWVQDGDDPSIYKDSITKSNDKPLYDKTLISRYLKMKFLESKGFDSTKAQDDFNQLFSFVTQKDKGGRVINAGGGRYRYPYLDSYRNTPDTNFGGVF